MLLISTKFNIYRGKNMVNQIYLSETQIKAILTYINGLKHHHMIRMLFMCSIGAGMRSINFCYLQLKDVLSPDGKIKNMITLNSSKNKGSKEAKYYLNKQMQKEFADYLAYLNLSHDSSPETYLFKSQKGNKPFTRPSISRIFSQIYRKFGIQGASHLGRHIYISRLINAGANPFVVQKLVNHQNISTTQHYYNSDPQILMNACELSKI